MCCLASEQEIILLLPVHTPGTFPMGNFHCRSIVIGKHYIASLIAGGTRNTEAVISIPSDAFLDSESVVYSLYETGTLFQVVPPVNETETDLEVDTMVVGFTLFHEEHSKSISSLINPVVLYFQGFRAQNGQVNHLYDYFGACKKLNFFCCG